jgi:alpha-1,3-rhamnosyltransferase
MTTKKVSIIVPSYNHGRFLKALIESIYNQTFKDFDLTVLDDGSKDDSPQILKELSQQYGFKLITKENEGLCRTLNRGLSFATGEYVVIIASDDFMPLTRLEEQVQFLDAHPKVDVVAGSMNLINTEGAVVGQKHPALKGEISFKDMLRTNRVFAATAMLRRSVYERFGTYKDYHVFEDFYMWLKVLRGGGVIYNTSNIWAFYRLTNLDLEKKFNWYFKGAVQALSEFPSDPLVIRQMRLHRLAYCVKMSLLLGRQFLVKYPDVIQKLSFLEKSFILLLSFTPIIIRNKAMKILKIKS